MSYGIRISEDGEDVKTCGDLKTVFNSKYALFKGAISGGGTITLTDAVEGTITITHNLGYIPITSVRISPNAGNYIGLPCTNFGFTPTEYISGYCYATATQLIIKLTNTNDAAGVQTRDVDYKYFIYKDKARI